MAGQCPIEVQQQRVNTAPLIRNLADTSSEDAELGSLLTKPTTRATRAQEREREGGREI